MEQIEDGGEDEHMEHPFDNNAAGVAEDEGRS